MYKRQVVKWVAFVVSMMEVIILVKLMVDLGKMLSTRKAGAEFCGRGGWLTQAKYWTVGMLFTSMVVSVPTFNTLIHGTQLVMGHAMGATVGIDSLVLLGTSSWLVLELRGDAIKARMDEQLFTETVCTNWNLARRIAHACFRLLYTSPSPRD